MSSKIKWVSLFLVLLSIAIPAFSQGIWNARANLQVLPNEISNNDLRSIMQGFTRSLGVRCDFCHAESDRGFNNTDFGSDEKPTKDVARSMMRMVKAINEEYIARPDALQVTCMTCHNGKSIPNELTDVLMDKLKTDGIEATVMTFDNLRERYYGTTAYDFSPRTQSFLVRQLLNEKKVEEALTLAKHFSSFEPKNPMLLESLGDVYVAKGERAMAITYYQLTLIESENARGVKEKLEEQLQGSLEKSH